ncbi:MAG TPA: hypothetical protein VFE62_16960 [Gemmataceae bacterium]|nr:hypothetical protein [Gemmataceae bacterium]
MSTTQIVYVALAAGLMLAWLALAIFGPRRLAAPGVLADMRYGVSLRCIALALALSAPMVMIYVIGTFEWKTEARVNIAGIALLAMSIIAGLLLIEVMRTQIILTEDALTRFSPWSGPATLNWSEVERVRYSAVNQWFLVEGAGRTIRVSRHLTGVNIFADLARRKLATAAWSGAAKMM